MARIGWDALSQTYRDRLTNAGLTRADYESGESIKKGRGHGKTPEHPRQYNPKDYPQYAKEQGQLFKDIETKKHHVWSGYPKWNPKKAARSAEAMKRNPPPLRLLRWALQASQEEIRDAIRESPEIFWWLGYN